MYIGTIIYSITMHRKIISFLSSTARNTRRHGRFSTERTRFAESQSGIKEAGRTDRSGNAIDYLCCAACVRYRAERSGVNIAIISESLDIPAYRLHRFTWTVSRTAQSTRRCRTCCERKKGTPIVSRSLLYSGSEAWSPMHKPDSREVQYPIFGDVRLPDGIGYSGRRDPSVNRHLELPGCQVASLASPQKTSAKAGQTAISKSS